MRVLVTGAARNIGLAIARAFLAEGARVLCWDVDGPALAAALDSLPASQRERALPYVADVRDPAAVAAGVARMVEAWGGVDVAVNNAGIYPDRLVLDMTPEEWDLVMDVNARGTFLVSQAAARAMVAGGIRGHIINIASGSYRFGRVGAAHYCASKAAVVMFTQVLAMELAPYGIQVNAVAPGLIASDRLSPEYVAAMTRMIPAGRIGRPEDVAAAVLMLVRSGCAYLTGQTIGVDGGLSAGRYGLPFSQGGPAGPGRPA